MLLRIAVCGLALLSLQAQDRVDLQVVQQIKAEAYERSKVMETLAGLTDRYGPRLTGSPEAREAADWASKRLSSWGMQNVHLEKWGPFGRSWSLEQYAVEMVEPRYALLTAVPLAWSGGTNGPVTGEVMQAVFRDSFNPKKMAEELAKFKEKYKGKLRGKVVLLSPVQDVSPSTQGLVKRYTDAELADLAKAVGSSPKIAYDPAKTEVPEEPEKLGPFFNSLTVKGIETFIQQIYGLRGERVKFLKDEGAAAVFMADGRARDGRTAAEQAGRQEAEFPMGPPTFVVTAEHYNRLVRLAETGTVPKVRVLLKVKTEEKVDSFNLVGELPGGAKKDELVMVGAHFDSWHAGTGATDNGAGSAVMMEVVRILKSLNLKLDRTVRLVLWTGEEQGLLGSIAYVKEHFADPKTMQLTSEHGRMSGYFNLDNGAGKIRGVYVENNDAMRPVFEQWLAPFRDMGVSTVTLRTTGGTDHLAFDAVGLPGFQFIQDPLDYGSVTHHGNMDVYDHAPADDLKQASAVIASVVYHAANRAEMLPRKALPKPAE
ncbi:M20/M25/M40 family metallo-hydrolase [Paludibaculum fermentans]|uniref:M20/M25/M40 family metallo-hydrolase n=1 Tax=Paludibaculum fermentans TaxID=1473598 RepID=UPI003EBBF565